MADKEKKIFRDMEFDVIAESTDGSALLVGECKWTAPEIASTLLHKLLEKAEKLPFAQNKKIIPVLFLKNAPKDSAEGINILYPQDVVDALRGD